MQQLYMLDASEIDFEFEGTWQLSSEGKNYNMISLTFIDPSLGGSGYLRRIAIDFHQVAKRAIAHLDHPNCETACYRCLKSYHNQRYHELLNWPQVIPALEQLAQAPPTQCPLKTGDIDDPLPWLEAYAAGVGSPLELKFLQLFEKYGFYPKNKYQYQPIHPFPLQILLYQNADWQYILMALPFIKEATDCVISLSAIAYVMPILLGKL